jgi:hypothetical protein
MYNKYKTISAVSGVQTAAEQGVKYPYAITVFNLNDLELATDSGYPENLFDQ